MPRIIGWLACVSAFVLLIVAMITGTAPAAAATGARVTGAWVRLPAVPGRPAAGYFTLSAGSSPAELTSVASPLARVELHAMSMAGGVMRKNSLPSVRLAAGKQVSFSPGGNHLMMFGMPASVRPGATVLLVFSFADGTTIKADAVARTSRGNAPMTMTH